DSRLCHTISLRSIPERVDWETASGGARAVCAWCPLDCVSRPVCWQRVQSVVHERRLHDFTTVDDVTSRPGTLNQSGYSFSNTLTNQKTAGISSLKSQVKGK
ncbi:unnamed protein product, partial [Ectocarpus sp. 12 AP-2014]